VTVDFSSGDCSFPVLGSIPTQSTPVQLRSRSYHSVRPGPALDDSQDEYCIINMYKIKIVNNKKIKK
jgi:hypothetical protein